MQGGLRTFKGGLQKRPEDIQHNLHVERQMLNQVGTDDARVQTHADDTRV